MRTGTVEPKRGWIEEVRAINEHKRMLRLRWILEQNEGWC